MQVQKLLRTVQKKYVRVNVLVNHAGIIVQGRICEIGKGAVTNFTRSLAMTCGEDSEDSVHVNVICPGFTLTDLTEEMKDDRQLLNKFYERIPCTVRLKAKSMRQCHRLSKPGPLGVIGVAPFLLPAWVIMQTPR